MYAERRKKQRMRGYLFRKSTGCSKNLVNRMKDEGFTINEGILVAKEKDYILSEMMQSQF